MKIHLIAFLHPSSFLIDAYGVGDGLGEACSDGGTLPGFGESGEVCR